MNREAIEIVAISKLKSKLSFLGYTIPEIVENDKTPSWDGFIKLYPTKDCSNKNGLVRIPVQVKGRYQKNPYPIKISFQIDKIDLENYLNDRGCIYFVVYLDDNDNCQIYYQTLTKLKIRRLLNEKQKQKQISILLDSFPQSNEDAVDVFFNFAKEMDYSLPDKDFTIKDVFDGKLKGSGFDTLNISYRGIKYKNDPWGAFINTKPTLCLKNSIAGIVFPIENNYELIMKTKGKVAVSIEGKKYYDTFEIIRKSNNQMIIILGKSFEFIFSTETEPTTVKFNYCIKGNLNERLNDIKFLLDFFKHKTIYFDNQKMYIPLSEEELGKVNIEYFELNYRLLDTISLLLKKLKVTEILDYDKVTDEDEQKLIELINSILYGEKYIHTNLYGEKYIYTIDEKFCWYNLKIANLNIKLFAEIINDTSSYLYNFFDEKNNVEFAYFINEKKIVIPKSFVLTVDDFAYLDNIDYDLIYNDIIIAQTSEELKKVTFHYINNIMFEGYKKRLKNKAKLKECIINCLKYLKKHVKKIDYLSLEEKFLKGE